MSTLKEQAEQGQLKTVKKYILKRVGKGETEIELFDWEPDVGNFSLFKFRVTREIVGKLKKELGFQSYKEDVECRSSGFFKMGVLIPSREQPITCYFYTIYV